MKKIKPKCCNSQRILTILLIVGTLILLYLCGCGPARLAMNVESLNNPDIEISTYKRFSFLSVNDEQALLEKNLQLMIREVMQQKGFIYDEDVPDFLIKVKFGVEKTVEQEKVRSRPVQVYQPEYGKPGKWETRYVTQGGGTKVKETKWIKIDLIDNKMKKDSGKTNVIWQGEVQTDDSNTFTEISPCLIMGLLADYPVKISSKPNRYIPYQDCKK